MASTTPCIYCNSPASLAKGHGDHIIPAQLGEFRGGVLFQRICRKCNSKVGKSEQQLLRCAPESFLRDIVKPNIPPGRKRGRSRVKGAAGSPSPEYTRDCGDHHALVHRLPDDPHNVVEFDQIIIHDEELNEFFIKLFPGMRPEQLQERIRKHVIKKVRTVWLHCDKKLWDEYQELIKTAYPEANTEELEPMKKGIHRVRCTITFSVNEHCFRALAKMAFHYYLTHSCRKLKGDEACFSALRSFIMGNGDSDHFFGKPSPTFMLPFGQLPQGGTVTPNQWCHFFVADESKDDIGVYMQLFVGQGCIPQPHYVTLATSASHMEVSSLVWGHAYVYDDPQRKERYAGQVDKLQITRVNSRLFLAPQDGWRKHLPRT